DLTVAPTVGSKPDDDRGSRCPTNRGLQLGQVGHTGHATIDENIVSWLDERPIDIAEFVPGGCPRGTIGVIAVLGHEVFGSSHGRCDNRRRRGSRAPRGWDRGTGGRRGSRRGTGSRRGWRRGTGSRR